MLATSVVMGTAAESVKLDDDVHEELRKLSESSGRPPAVLANDALRDFLRYEKSVAGSIDRGVSDLTRLAAHRGGRVPPAFPPRGGAVA